jgi:Fur family transcriptional regulator, peroxide stress response regulator
MKPALSIPADILKTHKIRVSSQRVQVLAYLLDHQCHPTVDQIYSGLLKDIHILSKTTVYNTLTLFVSSGLVRGISIEGNETRYDITVGNHGHFKCESCGEIYDFNIDIDSLPTEDLSCFMINDKNVYFKGICPKCLLL